MTDTSELTDSELAKLRAALANMPTGTLFLLAQQPAPAQLVEACAVAFGEAARHVPTASPGARGVEPAAHAASSLQAVILAGG